MPVLAGDSSFMRACARRDGHAARRAEIAKRARCDSRDLVPSVIETGGRLGVDAKAFARKLAEALEDPVTESAFLYRAISSILQNAVAPQLERPFCKILPSSI